METENKTLTRRSPERIDSSPVNGFTRETLQGNRKARTRSTQLKLAEELYMKRLIHLLLCALSVVLLSQISASADTITFGTTGFLQYTANNQTVFHSLALGPVTFGTNENNVTIGFTRLFPFQTFTIDPNNPVTNFGALNITVNGSGAVVRFRSPPPIVFG